MTAKRRCVLAAVIAAASVLWTSLGVHAATSWWNRIGGNEVTLAAYSDRFAPVWHLEHGLAATAQTVDHGTPAGMTMIAGSPTQPGVAIAAGPGGIWRRDASGAWSRSLLLLPQSLLSSAPAVTALAAFDRPLSSSIYLGTAGYGVLLTTDGGRSWLRDDLGLPSDVTALTTNSETHTLYAATNNGVWVHHLSAFPAPPVYLSGELTWRWLGIIAVALASIAAGSLALRRACR